MKKLICLSVLGLALIVGGCSDNEGARKALADQGFENIQTTGYRFFGCDEKDVYHTGFVAERNGRRVEGVVCSGWFKGNTVRTD